MAKVKTELDESMTNGDGEITYEEKLKFVSAISQPMASKKTAGRVYKLIKKASQFKSNTRDKSRLHVGLKRVQQRIRKGDRGIVILAGDVSPLDLICHLPAVCEENGLPYIYVPGRQDIGAAMGKNGGALMVLILHNEDYDETYNKVVEDIKKCPKPVSL